MGLVYKAVSPSGKAYTGQTAKSLRKRWREHCNEAFENKRNGCTALNRAIRKYGADAFQLIVLEDGIDDADLDAREIHHIKAEKSLSPNGYNMTSGGKGALNPCQEWRVRQGKRKRDEWQDPETRKNLARCHSDQSIQKVVALYAERRKAKAAGLSAKEAAKLEIDYQKSQKKRHRDRTMRQAMRNPATAAAWKAENDRMTPDDRKRFTCFEQRMQEISKLQFQEGIEKLQKLTARAIAVAKNRGTPLELIHRWYPNVPTAAELRAVRANGGVWPGSAPAPRASCAPQEDRSWMLPADSE